MTDVNKRTAIVVGAGIGGLSCAAALSPGFSEVWLVERDDLPARPVARRGVPQSSQAHLLLSGGYRALSDLFPGLAGDLMRAGGTPIDYLNDYRLEMVERPSRQAPSSIVSFAISRVLLENTLRDRVRAIPNVRLLDGQTVRQVMVDRDSNAVVGVRLAAAERGTTELTADLVVDASGRGTLLKSAFEGLDLPLPPRSEIEFGVSYATGRYRNVATPGTSRAVVTYPFEDGDPYGGILLPIEEDTYTATVVCGSGLKAPRDPGSFAAGMAKIRTTTIATALARAEPIGPIETFSFPRATWLHLEEATRLPGGFVAIGDSYCRFNPIYGQGMSIAAIGATTLRSLIKAGTPIEHLFEGYLRKMSPLIRHVWDAAVASAQSGTAPNEQGRRRREYQLAVLRAASRDAAVAEVVLGVAHLLRPSQDLQAPEIASRVQRELEAGSAVYGPAPTM